jgi:hypothetical protein
MNTEIIKYVFVIEKYEYENNSEKSIYAICKNTESLNKLVKKILETEDICKSDFEDDIFYYNGNLWSPLKRAYKISKVMVLE